MQRRRLSVWASIAGQLRDPLIIVLIAAALLTAATGDLTDAAVITFVVVMNSAVGVIQEVRADRAITALSQLSAPSARVRRDGHQVEVPTAELVPGDVVLLGEGDVVPADAAVVEASALLVDEAALTGESVPVGKAPMDGHHELSAGTVVVKGRAVAVVTATGARSALGRIAALLDTGVQATPLQRRLARLGRVLAGVVVVLCAVVLALGLFRGEPLERMVVTAISLVVAAVPESLPAVITLSLALGARAMARRRAIVRRLPAVETLGSITVLATDKTGTLTTGRMQAERAWTPLGMHVMRSGDTGEQAALVTPVERLALRDLFTAALLCNDAHLAGAPATAGGSGDGGPAGLGDPTEVALLLAGRDLGLDHAALVHARPREGEVPFDSTRQCMSTLHREPDGSLVLYSKGAPETVLARCTEPLDGGGTLIKRASAEATVLAEAGYRVLAVAAKVLRERLPLDAQLESVEHDLRLLGLVGIADPPKPAAAATISACLAAGISPVLITGDHPATARAVAERVGIATENVYARVTPERKLDIVQELRASGQIVAMVGDGVNDGPALRRSDIGVAMGHRGTEVARQAADLILADDELGTVVAAVEEGRRIYANVRRFLTYGLSGGAAEIAVMLVGPFVGLTVPLLAAQILWINFVTHGLTGVAIGAEPVEPGVMTRTPRPPNESVIGDGLWSRVLRISVVIAATTLAVGWWGHHHGQAWQSMMFVTLTTLQLGVALGLRAKPRSWQNPYLPLAAVGSFALVLAGLYLAPLRDVLDTVALPWHQAALAAVLGLVGWFAVRADLTFFRGAGTGRPSPLVDSSRLGLGSEG